MKSAMLPFVLCAVLSRDAAADPDAYQIFDRARHVLQTQLYPATIFYRTTVHVTEGAKDEFEHFRAEASNGDVRVAGVSQEEQASPQESHGVNFKLSFSIGWNTQAGGQTETVTEDAHRKEATPDFLGIPLIGPSYSFGLSSKQDEHLTENVHNDSVLRTIATVTAAGRVYRVSFLGMETIDGLYTYHLGLQPISEPSYHRVRALWIDAYTYQIVQLQTQGNFTASPMSEVPWRITFQNVDGNVYIASETALQPLVFQNDRTFSMATIMFDDIHTSDDGPPILPTMDSSADINLREP
jgi:hypothetical protein